MNTRKMDFFWAQENDYSLGRYQIPHYYTLQTHSLSDFFTTSCIVPAILQIFFETSFELVFCKKDKMCMINK